MRPVSASGDIHADREPLLGPKLDSSLLSCDDHDGGRRTTVERAQHAIGVRTLSETFYPRAQSTHAFSPPLGRQTRGFALLLLLLRAKPGVILPQLPHGNRDRTRA